MSLDLLLLILLVKAINVIWQNYLQSLNFQATTNEVVNRVIFSTNNQQIIASHYQSVPITKNLPTPPSP